MEEKDIFEFVSEGGEEKVEEKEKVQSPKVRPVPPKLITFDRYFNSLGRPGHHKAGMMAYVNTKGKKSREVWDSLFKDY